MSFHQRSTTLEALQLFKSRSLWGALALLVITALIVRFRSSSAPPPARQPPPLSETVPHVSNAYQYLTDMKAFLRRAGTALERENIIRMYLGPIKLYLVAGAQNTQAMFRSSTAMSSDAFMIRVVATVWDASPEDVAKFANDKSGRLKAPASGAEDTPPEERYWAGMHHVMHEYLARMHPTNKLAETYYREYAKRLERFPVGERITTNVLGFLKKDIAEAAITALCGTKILELAPDLVTLLWDFDEASGSLTRGLPRWIDREAWKRSDRFKTALSRYLDAAWANYDWSGPDVDADWDPHFGSRFLREMAKWAKESRFTARTSAGVVGVTGVFALNANTIPIAAWSIMELAKDSALLGSVRKEALSAYVTDPATGERTLDVQKLLALPLLQSVYAEALRLHVSINVTREVIAPITLGGFQLPQGALVQAPTELAHRNEHVWSADGHPASEFWGERFVSYSEIMGEDGSVEKVPQFSMAGKSGQWFPYGGGVSICPGRHFAKQEIMMSIAMLVARFDIDFVEWTTLNGGLPSDRPAENDPRFAGTAAVPPDRDMKVGLRRVW
ncbi:cytochrome P450 [Colletotrichum cereale]|nr:cytochrome P450 [Colletotrichum cereale]